jgi:hypothetical protein
MMRMMFGCVLVLVLLAPQATVFMPIKIRL